MIGIYKITNKLNNKCYIGQSIDIERRWEQHKNFCKNNQCKKDDWHYDLFINLQNYNFSIVEECKEEELNSREQYWIEYFNSYIDGYNKNAGANYTRQHNGILIHINKNIDGEIFEVSWEDYCAAARELSPSALNLYMYLAKNKDGYEFFFSSKDYCDTFKVVDKTFRNAKNELINKGYLREESKNRVNFSSSAAFKETKDNLQEKLKELNSKIKLLDESIYNDFLEKVAAANLPKIQDSNIYKIEIKKLISFAEDILKEFSEREISKLL